MSDLATPNADQPSNAVQSDTAPRTLADAYGYGKTPHWAWQLGLAIAFAALATAIALVSA